MGTATPRKSRVAIPSSITEFFQPSAYEIRSFFRTGRELQCLQGSCAMCCGCTRCSRRKRPCEEGSCKSCEASTTTARPNRYENVPRRVVRLGNCDQELLKSVSE